MLRRSDFCSRPLYPFFSFNDTATTEIYSLSLHDALPISRRHVVLMLAGVNAHPGHAAAVQLRKERAEPVRVLVINGNRLRRSEEHTSELQSHSDLVCRLLLEKKKSPPTSSRTTGNASRVT